MKTLDQKPRVLLAFIQGYIFLKISETIPYPDLKISKLFRNFKEILGHKLHAFSFISTSIKRYLVQDQDFGSKVKTFPENPLASKNYSVPQRYRILRNIDPWPITYLQIGKLIHSLLDNDLPLPSSSNIHSARLDSK